VGGWVGGCMNCWAFRRGLRVEEGMWQEGVWVRGEQPLCWRPESHREPAAALAPWQLLPRSCLLFGMAGRAIDRPTPPPPARLRPAVNTADWVIYMKQAPAARGRGAWTNERSSLSEGQSSAEAAITAWQSLAAAPSMTVRSQRSVHVTARDSTRGAPLPCSRALKKDQGPLGLQLGGAWQLQHALLFVLCWSL
jgi:hypothetical protein